MGDNQFKHLQKKDVTASSVSRYELLELGVEPSPVLIVKPATDANGPYQRKLLKSVGKRARRNLDANTLKKIRAVDRELFPQEVIVGWEGMPGKDGKAVEFSVQNCIEFLQILPDYIFDEVRAHCSETLNFVEETPHNDPEVVAEVGNVSAKN